MTKNEIYDIKEKDKDMTVRTVNYVKVKVPLPVGNEESGLDNLALLARLVTRFEGVFIGNSDNGDYEYKFDNLYLAGTFEKEAEIWGFKLED